LSFTFNSSFSSATIMFLPIKFYSIKIPTSYFLKGIEDNKKKPQIRQACKK